MYKVFVNLKETSHGRYIPGLIDGTLQSFLLRYCGKDKDGIIRLAARIRK